MMLGVPYSLEINQILPTPENKVLQEQRESLGDELLAICNIAPEVGTVLRFQRAGANVQDLGTKVA